MTRRAHLLKTGFVVIGVLLWALALSEGIRVLWQYSTTPGRLAEPPPKFPGKGGIRPAADRAALMLFLHPQCPCSRASVGELASILAHAPDKAATTVVVYRPVGEGVAWAQTDLWQSAAAIPGVHVVDDPGGAVARRFGVSTSGQILLYDSGGRLVFNGGITAFRGHSGDNDGSDAILALLRGQPPGRHRAPVFGCSLLGEP